MNSILEAVEMLLNRGGGLRDLAALAQECADSSSPLALDGLLPRLEQAASAGEGADPGGSAALWEGIGLLRQTAADYPRRPRRFRESIRRSQTALPLVITSPCCSKRWAT